MPLYLLWCVGKESNRWLDFLLLSLFYCFLVVALILLLLVSSSFFYFTLECDFYLCSLASARNSLNY